MMAFSKYLCNSFLFATPFFACLASNPYEYSPSWSSYVGGDYSTDTVYAVAVDSATNTFLGGTYGDGWIHINADSTFSGSGFTHGYVAKAAADGSVAWVTEFSDNAYDTVKGLAVAPQSKLAVAGITQVSLADEGTYGFVSSLNTTNGAAGWFHTTGAYGATNGFNAVATDTNGNVYAVGYTSLSNLAANVSGYSSGGNTYGLQPKGGLDALVVKYSPNGTLLWRHYLGGANNDQATAVAVTSDGSVYVGGETYSPGWATLSTNAPSTSNRDGFIVKFTSAGAHVWSAFLNGSANDTVAALAADPTNRTVYVGGRTLSGDFLSASTRLNSLAGSTDGFVVKLTDTNTAFRTEWCRFVGGSASDRVNALSLQTNGTIIAGGATSSGGWLAQATTSSFGGVQDGFFSFLDGSGAVLWSSYLGGAQSDEILALASKPGLLFAAGKTLSSGWVSGGFWTSWSKDNLWGTAGDFGFVAKWSNEPGTPPTLTSEPADVTVHEGQAAAFSTSATGFQPLYYFWSRNGTPIAGATSNGYVIASAAATNNNDTYSCLVSNYWGTATTRAAKLTVIANGTLSVTLSPANAVAQGAKWSLDSGATWLDSGSATNLWPGTNTLTFSAVSGWITPAALPNVVVSSGATTSRTGTYTPILPAAARAISGTNVTVTVQAPAGLSTWTLVENLPAALTPTNITAGGVWNSGAHTLTFTGAEATTNTYAYTVICATSGLYAVSGTVTPQPANVPVAVTGASQILKANLVRTISGNSVTITVYQPSSSFIWSATESIPEGLTPTNMAGPNAAWDDVAREISWYRKGVGVTLTYQVEGAPGTYTLSGFGHVAANDEPIFGDSVLTLASTNAVPPPNILSFYPSGANTFTLAFTSVVNQAYVIVTNASLAHTNGWATYLPVTGGAGVTQQQVQKPATNLFFRVRSSP